MLLYHFDNVYLIYQYRDIFVIPTTAIANVIEAMRLPIKSKNILLSSIYKDQRR